MIAIVLSLINKLHSLKSSTGQQALANLIDLEIYTPYDVA
jgi:hypothetical protein